MEKRMRLLLTMGLALALAACGGSEEVANNSVAPTPSPTPGPMLGGLDLNKPVRAAGAGPFWSMDIAPGTIAYVAAPGAHRTDFYPVDPKLSEGRAVYETQTPEAEPVKITLTGKSCTAGKQTLPLTVEARIGARTLHGCAGPLEYVGAPIAETGGGNSTKAH
jgi:uncharacterized membrane protein